MPCLICDATLQNLGLNDGPRRVFWCARCGALKIENGDHDTHDEPLELRRLRQGIREALERAGEYQRVRVVEDETNRLLRLAADHITKPLIGLLKEKAMLDARDSYHAGWVEGDSAGIELPESEVVRLFPDVMVEEFTAGMRDGVFNHRLREDEEKWREQIDVGEGPEV